MTHYRCIRCGALGDDKETLDHAIGLSKGRPCAGGPDAPLEEIGKAKTETAATETTAEIPTKSRGRPKKGE